MQLQKTFLFNPATWFQKWNQVRGIKNKNMNTAQTITYTSIKLQLLQGEKVVSTVFPKNVRKFPKGMANKIKDGGIQCFIHVEYSNHSQNEILCKCPEDLEYAKTAFIEEYK